MKIAVINSGSSSIKFKLFCMDKEEVILSILLENIGEESSDIRTHKHGLTKIFETIKEVDIVGHRVVHGGEEFHKATLIDNVVIQKIQNLIPLAPLHNPANLEGIKIIKEKFPNIPQIAVFDTSFHFNMPKNAYLYALNYEMYEKHNIRRYGFHGTSHSFVLKTTAKRLNKSIKDTNIISLHLGNGASACAIKNGVSIDTSMGFTPLEGLIMGSRCGDIDPAIVLYMQRELNMNVNEIDNQLNKKSGLIGICSNNDVRKIIASDDEKSKLAIDMMIRRIQKYIGSYMILLEKVDAIVFTGGIGENSSYIRNRILDNEIIKNIKSLVVKTDEELEIARECLIYDK
ncbi:MAG: acetate kinase [Campylobacterota bacterium]|nr:acetate kinase [Campylobacterota bacterium]